MVLVVNSSILVRRRSAQAFIKADSDAKLRRAFTQKCQKYQEMKDEVAIGQKVWYWRNAGAGILRKARWRGPARVVAIEEINHSARVIWLCHGTSLVRCAPSQVRPMVEDTGFYVVADRSAALRDLEELKARSTTQFRDQMTRAQHHGREEPGYDPDELDAEYSPELDPDEGDGDAHESAEELAPELPGIVLSALPALARREDQGERERTPRRRMSDADTEAPLPDTARGSDEPPTSPKRKPDEKVSDRPAKSTRTESTDRPEQVPVPEAADDELFFDDIYMVQVDELPSGWRCVSGGIELDEVYVQQTVGGTNKQQAARKNEVNTRKPSPDEQAAFVEAKRKELEQFFEHQVWEFATPAESQEATQARRVVSARWVLTWKRTNDDKPDEPPKYKAKARLVLRGFEDPDLLSMKTAAPTASKMARRMLLAVAVWYGWTVWCGDVKAAFLPGGNFSRVIIVRLPKDANPLVGDGQVDQNGYTHMRLKKSACGLADAPVEWYGEARDRLLKSKWKLHPLDQCCFLMIYTVDKKVKVCGILILHVDDMLVTGDRAIKEFDKALDNLKENFNFGKWEQLSNGHSLKYCGGQIYQNEWGIEVSYAEYIRKVCPVTINKGRKPQDDLSMQEISKYRALIGALQWPSTQGLPMLAASASLQAGVQDLMDLNKTLRFAKQVGDVTLKFLAKPQSSATSLDAMVLVAYADAAFGVRRDHASQGGYIIMACDKSVLDGAKVPASTVGWTSLAAECQATTTALDELVLSKTFLEVLKHPMKDLKDLKDQLSGISACVTDCRALYDAVYRETIQQAQDKRVAIEGLIIKQTLKETKTVWRWVSSERQLADGLTKVAARQAFSERFAGHYVQLVADESYTAAKKKTQQQRQETLRETRAGTGSHVAQSLIAAVMVQQSAASITEDFNDIGSYVTYTIPDSMTGGGLSMAWSLAALYGIWQLLCQLVYWMWTRYGAPHEQGGDISPATRQELSEEVAFLNGVINEQDSQIEALNSELRVMREEAETWNVIHHEMLQRYGAAVERLPQNERLHLLNSDDEASP